ncbi:hypothetical protein BH11MYX1_BH11MYX1_09990 [soil metagenome]
MLGVPVPFFSIGQTIPFAPGRHSIGSIIA